MDSMTVAEIAKRVGVEPHVVRYYTRIGLLKPDRNLLNGYQQFEETDVKRLHFIRFAQILGFTLQEIAEIFETCERYSELCPGVADVMRRRLDANGRAVDALILFRQRMETALAEWKGLPEGVPSGHAIQRLIDSAID